MSLTNLLYHIVFSTKDRQPLITNAIEQRLYESQVTRVRQYIRNQKNHHKKISFQEELISLLKAHKIQFDEKYLWR